MKALLKEQNILNKTIWLADSFQGLPKPNTKQYPADQLSNLHTQKILTVSRDEVETNFKKFDLLDDRVIFLEGWFKDTLPGIKTDKFALLRLDGDLYESTHLALEHLYPKLSPGGYIIIDDYNAFPYCKSAVDQYRTDHNITAKMIKIDAESVYWKKP